MKNPFALRAKMYRSIHMFGAWYALAIMDDDELTWKDAPETIAFGAGLAWVWWDLAAASMALSTTPLVVVEVAVVAGAAASFAIDGVEGVETYVDYINPTNWKKNMKDPEKVEALLKANRVLTAVVTLGGSELARYGLENLKPWREELFKNRYLTGPHFQL
jgi:hypothetical protein